MDVEYEDHGLQKHIESLEAFAEKSEEGIYLSLGELFTNEFIRKYTHFSTLDEMFNQSPFDIETTEDFEAIPDEEWDKYVDETTEFESWEDMLGKAAEEYTLRELGFSDSS